MYFWWNANFVWVILSHEYRCASNVEDKKKHSLNQRKFVDVLHCIFSKKKNPTSFALDHSRCSRMIVILEKSSILWRCQSPYHHRWQTCHKRVSPYLWSTFHQISTLEKTTCHQCSILRSLMSLGPIRVSPYWFVDHYTSAEVRSDFQIWFSPGFPKQSRPARSDLSHGIVIPNSSSALILPPASSCVLFDIASRLLMELKWRMLLTNTKDESIHHMWSFPWSVCLRVGFWCQYNWFESWCPNWFYETTNQKKLCGFWKYVSL